MAFGITTSKIDKIALIVYAENLGYDFCWVYGVTDRLLRIENHCEWQRVVC
jgi:hypothetical protein